MSSYERWRRFKIVELPKEDKGKELIGGLKNALERGETLMKAKTTLLNAGYKQEDVEAAAKKVSQPLTPQAISQNPTPQSPPATQKNLKSTLQQPPQPTPQNLAPQPPQTIPQNPVPKKKMSFLIKFLIAFAVIDIIGAIFFIVFWDKIF